MGGTRVFRKACPCGGDIRWTWWDSDCRGNDGGSIIDCDKCHRKFTPDDAREHTKGKKSNG